MIREAARRALEEANCDGGFERRIDTLAQHLALVDGQVVPIDPATGAPRTRADISGSGRQLPIPLSELVYELSLSVRAFAWRFVPGMQPK